MYATAAGFRGIWAIYIHSNVRLPIGPLRKLIGSPELHHWHHDRDRDAGNYANLSPLMDILFGTYRCPGHEPERFGLNQPTPSTYLGHLIQPLLPAKRPQTENSLISDTETFTEENSGVSLVTSSQAASNAKCQA